jgi:predicted ATPase/class 3 adenylate cyclase
MGAGTAARSEAQVTFLFTDIEASTRAWERRPEAMSRSLARHDELLHLAVKEAGGTVFKHTGDGICAAFDTAAAALAAALEAQRSLLADDWQDSGPLEVRMALHTGAAERRGNDFFGPALNRTARLLDIAHGRQVVLSLVATELVRDELPSGADVVDLGEHRLADLNRPERVFQLAHPDLPAVFPPLRSLGAHRHNLPIAASSFVGRAHELEAVSDLLRTARLVTLVGVGGVGKTRLALQLAAGLLEDHPDGVFFVDLAPLAEPGLLPAQIGRALGLVEREQRPGGDAREAALCEYLRWRRMLLVLDNCEHLVEAVAALSDAILQSCPETFVLATSREPLAISGEIVWRVPSMALPPAGVDFPEQILDADAVALFCERARAADAAFRLGPENAVAVARICRRLDGIPLALELAAARIRVLSAAQVADRLDDRFRLLNAGPRTAVPRQQTLRATMDWSYELLPPPERLLLQRLSVFAGNFDLEAVEGVAADGDDLEAADVLDLLGRLVDKSLVVVTGKGAAARYRLLETVRQYAGERLVEIGRDEEFRRRHRDYCLGYADRYLAGDPVAEANWLPDHDLSYYNMSAALDWSLAHHDTEACLRLVALLVNLWVLGGHFAEGRSRIEQVLALAPPEPTRALLRTINGFGFLLFQQGEFDRAISLNRHAQILAREAGETGDAAVAGFFVGTGLLHQGRLDESERVLHQAYEDHARAGSAYGMGWCETMLGWLSLARGDRAEAAAHFEQALAVAGAGLHDNLTAHAVGGLAPLVALQGQADRARVLADESLRSARRLGLNTILVMALTRATEVAILLGDCDRAEALLREELALLRDTGGQAFLADALEMTSLVHEARGRDRQAARFLGAADGVRRASGESPDLRSISPGLDRCRTRLTDTLGDAVFTEERALGARLAPPEALSLAIQGLQEALPVEPAPGRVAPFSAPTTATLRRSGTGWEVAYGDISFEVPDMKGLRYLARLLACPGREIHVLDLVADGVSDRGDAGPVLDERAKAAYRRRVRELQEDIEEARGWSDPERAARAEAELEAVSHELASALGLGGRDRPAASSAERARIRVRKTITAAIARLADHHADLGLLLSTTVKTGTYCSYTPDPRLPVDWQVSAAARPATSTPSTT